METDFFPPSGFGKIAIYVNENGGEKAGLINFISGK